MNKLAMLLAIHASLRTPTEDELVALRRRCAEAPLLGLGQILMDCRHVAEERIVAAEISRRLAERSRAAVKPSEEG